MGKKIFFFNRFRSDSGPGRKKIFEFQTVKMVKLGGVGQERQNYIQEQDIRNRIFREQFSGKETGFSGTGTGFSGTGTGFSGTGFS
jgi:hypothetical protein